MVKIFHLWIYRLFVGEKAYSIKPDTYNTLPNLQESIEVKIIYYEKKSDGSVVFEIPED